MTSRSPKQSKTTTISRKARSRTDQAISNQPPQLQRLRGLRPRRVPSLPSGRRISVNYPNAEPHPVWNPSELIDPTTRGNTSHPTVITNKPPAALLSKNIDFASYSPSSDSTSKAGLVKDQSNPVPIQEPLSNEPFRLPSPSLSQSGEQPVAYYQLPIAADPIQSQDPSFQIQVMSTLGYMMPAQYGSLDQHYASPSSMDSPSFPPTNSQPYSEARQHQRPSSASPYPSAYTSTSTAQGQPHARRVADTVLPPYQSSSIPRSPYQQPLGSMRASPTSMSYPPSSEPSPLLSSAPQAYAYSGGHPAQNLSPLIANSSSYPPPALYPPTSYEMNSYSPLPPTMYPSSSTSAPYSPYDSPTGLAPPTPGSVQGLPTSPGAQGNGMMPRVLNSRPKPQCWEHGCNGRQFSTFSNLLRHQREKSGTAAKSYCPRCGAEFTRTTARNGHMAHEKCKPRRASDSSR